MNGLVRAFIALRNEFQLLQKPLAEPGFERFDLKRIASAATIEEVGQDLLILKGQRRFADETRQ